jgi:hypothetical protein
VELFVVPLIVAVVGWVAWKMRTKRVASDQARLDAAWRIVLSDPNYEHRRRVEEYNREVEAKARKAEEEARKVEGL